MDSNPLTLTHDNVIISGKHYTVSNGFLSKADGEVRLKRSDIVSVNWVKRRSKRGMYAVLILGSILIAVLSMVRGNIGIDNVQEAYDLAHDVYEFVQDGRDSALYETARTAMTVVIVLTAIVTIIGAGYLFSGRRYAEFTTMQGTYRMAVRGEHKQEMKDIVLQLRARM
jgi:hypothetical protein